MKSVEPKYTVDVSKPQKIADNVYEIRYRIVKKEERCAPKSERKIVRVELGAGTEVLQCKTRGNLEEGCFTLDVNKHPALLKTDFTYNIFAWDDTFNCVFSIERFIFAIPSA